MTEPSLARESQTESPKKRPRWGPRLALFVILAALIAVFVSRFQGELSLSALVEREAEFRAFYQLYPAETLAIAFLVYVAVTSLSLPGAAAMSLLYGWLFGFWRALILVSFASTAGATIAFLISRYLIGDFVQSRFGPRLAAVNSAIERDGAFYLFTLRLIPQLPFFVVNVAMGLTPLPTWTFWWISQLGMLPGTIVYVLAGASAPSLKHIADRGIASLLDWKLAGALVLLGLLPLVLRWVLRRSNRMWVTRSTTKE